MDCCRGMNISTSITPKVLNGLRGNRRITKNSDTQSIIVQNIDQKIRKILIPCHDGRYLIWGEQRIESKEL